MNPFKWLANTLGNVFSSLGSGIKSLWQSLTGHQPAYEPADLEEASSSTVITPPNTDEPISLVPEIDTSSSKAHNAEQPATGALAQGADTQSKVLFEKSCSLFKKRLEEPLNEANEAQAKNTLFSTLTSHLLEDYILPQLKPCLEVIEGEATDTQKSLVTACSEKGEPRPNVYHLLIKRDDNGETTYHVGFAKKKHHYLPSFLQQGPNVEYATQPLSTKGVLYRLVREDSHLFPAPGAKNPTTHDSFILKYVQREIEGLGGLTLHPAAQRAQLAAVSKGAVDELAETIKQEAHEMYLHHVAYSEQEQAEKILQRYPEFLLAKDKGEVVDATRERTFLATTGLQLAVWNRDWHMYNMMLKYIPHDQADNYKADMYQQLEELETNGLEYELNNLKHNGLRVVELDEFTERRDYFEENITRRNAYLLIRDNANKTCELGFRDPKTGEYRQENLSTDNNFYQFVFDEHNTELLQRPAAGSYRTCLRADTLPFLVTRDERVLCVAREAIERLGGNTTFIENSSALDLSAVQAECKALIDNSEPWTPVEKVEQAVVMIGGAQRSFSVNVWDWWYCRQVDWSSLSSKSFTSRARERAVDFSNVAVAPVSTNFGGRRASLATGASCSCYCCRRKLILRHGDGWAWIQVAQAAFLENFLSSSIAELSNLKDRLGAVSHQQTCRLM